MKNRILLPLIGAAALALTACGGGTTPTKPGVEDKSVGAESSAAGAAGGVEGKALDSQGKAADLLNKRRIYFAFDSSAIDDESRAVVEAHANHLAANKTVKVVFEGHADERGSREYNLALGERRAQAVERMAKLLGVSADRVKVVSYGEEKPLAAGHDEGSWSQNRRVEIVY
jgi:peptidoglycan-associated lipoprotein